MGVIKFTVLASLLSLTLSSASHAAGEPVVNPEMNSPYTSSATIVHNFHQASYTPAEHQFSNATSDQPNYGTAFQFTDEQIVPSPPVATASMIEASAHPSTVQSRLAPVVERVAHLSVNKPATVALKSLAADESLVELVRNSNGTVLIDFYADWCGPCRKQSQILADMEDTASQLDALIIKVNVDQHRDLAASLNVKSLPTILVLKDGQLVNRQSGIADHSRIEAMLSR